MPKTETMKSGYRKSAVLISSILLLLVIMILPFAIIDPAEALTFTLDEFSSGRPLYSLLITIVLILFGVISTISGWKLFEGLAFQRFMILAFGCTFIAAAVFTNIELYNSLNYSVSGETVHRCFSGMAVISFSVLAASTAFLLSESRGRMISFLVVAAVILSVLIQSESEKYDGLWQRMILAIIAGWMLYIYKYSELKLNKIK
jgi:hypothetical protein